MKPLEIVRRVVFTVTPQTRSAIVAGLLIFPMLLLLVPFFMYPLLGIIARSFSEDEAFAGHYRELFQSDAFRSIMLLTFKLAAYTTLWCLMLGFPFAYFLSTLRTRPANILLVLSTIPLWTSVLARLYSWTIILGRRGVINNILIDLGIIDEPAELLFNTFAATIGMVHVLLPYMIIVLYSSMRGIDPALVSASRSLGATPSQAFRKIYIPLAMPGIFASCLLVFVLSLGFYIGPAVLGGGSDITIARYVLTQVTLLRWGVATAMSIILLAVTLVVFVVLNRLFGMNRLILGGTRK